MKRVLFSNYFWENDENGKDMYDYARECLFDEDTEHRFTDKDYISNDAQMKMEGFETFICPICGEEYNFLEDAKECCRNEKWETADDIPKDILTDFVYSQNERDWEDFKFEFGHFLKKSKNGFLLCGNVGRWDGNYQGGEYVNCFDDLYDFWKDCDYIKVYDENGHIFIKASHHDGTNYAELKELTDKGKQYKDNHYWDSDCEVHSKIFGSSTYSRLPRFAEKVWGCK